MTKLIEFRERIRRFYSKNGRYVVIASKFLLMFLSLFMVTSTLAYKGIFSSVAIILVASVIASFMPHSVSLFILLAAIGTELFAAGIEALAVYALMILVFVACYFIFKPGKSYCVTLSVLLGVASFYGPLPMIIGLMFTPISCIGMGIGIVIANMVTYVANNNAIFAQTSALSMTKKITQIVDGVFLDENLWITLFLAISVAILIYIIRRMSTKYSWSIAITVGCLCTLLLSVIISLVLDTSENYLVLIINIILEAITGVVLMFLFFMVDYSREELLQFEDDEYYYYVKAVPKLTMAIQDMKVTRIREHNIKNITRSSENVTFIKNKDVPQVPTDTIMGIEDRKAISEITEDTEDV